jgi:hypothetical protein
LLDDDVFALHITELAQTLPKRLQAICDCRGSADNEKAYSGNLHRLLRSGGYTQRQQESAHSQTKK